jgi:glycosyltransferase involved in cell wall biosynthesis
MDRKARVDIGAWRGLIGQMRERRIDILHTHKVGSNFWGALIAPRVPVEVFVAHEHTWSFEGNLKRRLLDRFVIARQADAFVAVSRADQRRMVEIEKIPPEVTRFIPNGIPDPGKTASDRDVRAELGIDPGRPLIGMVATLRPQKAYDVLIRAAAELRREVPDLAVLIVGGEEDAGTREKERLQALVDELELTDTVTLLGFRPDVFDIVSALDVACLSSDFEGSPLSVMEYMEAARPVVATSVGGVPDLVVEGVTGLLVDPQDPAGLAAAVATLLRDPERAKAMGLAGRERRRSEFSIEATTRAVEDLYLELYANR